MTITETLNPEAAVLRLEGRLDGTTAPQVQQRVDALAAAGPRALVFDLSQLEYVSSAGLRVFISAAKKYQNQGKTTTFAALTPAVRQVFELSGFLGILDVRTEVSYPVPAGRPAPAAGGEAGTAMHLSFVEEILLLALDDVSGAFLPRPEMGLEYALAGALLADLAVAGRIDTDASQLTLLNGDPTGDPILDRALVALQSASEPQPVSHWLSVFASQRDELQQAALERLVARGILKQSEKKFLWVFGVRRYPTLDNQERTEVRTRLSELILGDAVPDPRDAILISLLVASDLLSSLFDEPQYRERSSRIANLAKMDLIGREVAAAIDNLALILRNSMTVMGGICPG